MMKRLIASIGSVLIGALPTFATDINKGVTFLDGSQYFAQDFNNFLDLATINSQFYTTKSVGTPQTGDVFLFVRSGTYYRCTYDTLIAANAALITGQAEDATPAYNDFLLTYDASAAGLRKSALNSLVFTNAALIYGRNNDDTPAEDSMFLGMNQNGTYFRTYLSNLFSSGTAFTSPTSFTNLAFNTTPNALDRFLLFSSVRGTNEQTTAVGLITNLSASTIIGSTDVFMAVIGGDLKKVPFSSISNSIATNVVASYIPTNTVTTNITLGTGSLANWAHGLGGTPQIARWVLRCTAADQGYSAGDELGIEFFENGSVLSFSGGANATNIYLTCISGTLLVQVKGTTTGYLAIDNAKWVAKGYFYRFP